jgi:hypothetical protein
MLEHGDLPFAVSVLRKCFVSLEFDYWSLFYLLVTKNLDPGI